MTDFSKPIQTKCGGKAKVLARYENLLWIRVISWSRLPSTWTIGHAEKEFINIPEDQAASTAALREELISTRIMVDEWKRRAEKAEAQLTNLVLNQLLDISISKYNR